MKSLLALALLVATPLAASPLRIGKISIRSDSLFSDEEVKHGGVYRVLDRLHTHTHEDLLRRVLLIHEGDLYDPLLIAESEKNLRRLDFIKTATITPGAPHDGVVDITVETQDEWTTDPNIDLAHGGSGSWSMNVTQKDLFGTGAELSLTDARNAERTVRSLELLDPLFIRPYWNLEMLIGRNSDGGEKKVLLEQPFYSSTTKTSFSFYVDDRSLSERLFRGGMAFSQFHAQKTQEHAMFGRAISTAGGSQRIFFGYEGERSVFTPDVGSTFLPPSHGERFAVIGYEFDATVPLKLDYVDHDARLDDFSAGVRASVFGGLGAGVGEMRGEIRDGIPLGDHGVLLSRLSYGTRIHDRLENQIVSGEVRFVWKFDTGLRQTFVSRIHADGGSRLDGDTQFFADELRGLRGYHTFAMAGDRAIVVNAEQRFFLGRELAQIVAPGFAIFVDSGSAGGMHEPMRFRSDAGAGLRFSLNRAESTVLRIDLTRDFGPAVGPHRRWAMSVGTSQAF